ncbi:hypothetical protein [Chryseobacterium proteolyticum]|uniref:hypothetical protein n=1 Tax=Chryseobacterium proteolyticum TaxID=118127 RepID=UPI0039832CD4
MKNLVNLLLVLITFGLTPAQKLIHKEIFSPRMNKNIKTIIITPDIKPKETYKTVYILHGFSGNPDRLVKEDLPNLLDKAKTYNTIYILPDGNYSSWYVDSPLKKRLTISDFYRKRAGRLYR